MLCARRQNINPKFSSLSGDKGVKVRWKKMMQAISGFSTVRLTALPVSIIIEMCCDICFLSTIIEICMPYAEALIWSDSDIMYPRRL